MGIDANDLKILVNTGFQYLIKACHQWAKDHPLVSGVLLFFYLLYIFFPYLFNILFYTFPLIMCSAILLGGPHINLRETQKPNKNDDKYTTFPCLTSQLNRRTLGKNKDVNNAQTNKVVPRKKKNAMCMKQGEEETKACNSSNENHVIEQTPHSSTGITSRSDSESQDDDDEDEQQDTRNKVIEWTEDDQRNLMDLGSSEIERNKRLESLIAKRRARKLLSMQPRRNHYDNLMDQVGSIMVTRYLNDVEHQPGSAPCTLIPTRNPFDLPYDPHEERPILTGGSFDEQFNENEQNEKESSLSKHEHKLGEFKEDPFGKSLPSFFTKPKSIEQLPAGFTRFRRESGESIKEIMEELSKEDTRNSQELNRQVSSDNDQLNQSYIEDNQEHHELENPFAREIDSLETSDIKEENFQDNKENIFHMEKEENNQRDDEDNQLELSQEQTSMIEDGHDDDNEETSSSASTEININTSKNEAFRNSVRKVLTCLVMQKNRGGHVLKDDVDATSSSNNIFFDTVPHISTPTKMEERSFYTKPHHSTTFSIASDMQVEVSEAGSPPLATFDPTSPTDQESLVYDGDVDKDANSGDEDLWGASPHPMKTGDFAPNYKMSDRTEETIGVNRSNLGGMLSESNSNTLVGENNNGVDEIEQRITGEVTSSSLSPTSILPKEIGKGSVDQKSGDGDFLESISSISSSDGLMTQMQARSEHVAEYLANLPSSESGSNGFEDPESSHAREPSAIQDDVNLIFEMDEDKEELREVNKIHELKESNGHSITSQNRTTNKPHIDHANQHLYIEEQNHPPNSIEDEPTLTQTNAMENKTSVILPMTNEISDSLSTTNEDEILERSRYDEGNNAKLEDYTKGALEIPNDGEVKDLPSTIVYDDATHVERITNEGNSIVCDMEKPVISESCMEQEEMQQEIKDSPQPATIEDSNMELSSSTEVVTSRPIKDPDGKIYSNLND